MILKSKLLEKEKKQFEELNKLKLEVGVLENTRPYKDSDIAIAINKWTKLLLMDGNMQMA